MGSVDSWKEDSEGKDSVFNKEDNSFWEEESMESIDSCFLDLDNMQTTCLLGSKWERVKKAARNGSFKTKGSGTDGWMSGVI